MRKKGKQKAPDLNLPLQMEGVSTSRQAMEDSGGLLGGQVWSPMEWWGQWRERGSRGREKTQCWANDSWLSELLAVPPLWLFAGLSGESVCVCVWVCKSLCVCVSAQSTSGGGNTALLMFNPRWVTLFCSQRIHHSATQNFWLPCYYFITINTSWFRNPLSGGPHHLLVTNTESIKTSCWGFCECAFFLPPL